MHLLKLQGVSKGYPGVQALDDVSLTLDRGDIHALVGKNGAGKSTLIKVLGGVIVPDSGTITMDGRAVEPGSPHASIAAGIAIVHQELSLNPHLSVGENVFLGRSSVSAQRRSVIVDWAEINTATRTVLQRLHSDIDPLQIVGQLSIAQQQIVEIAKALARDPKLLVLDEPTSALADGDANHLLEVLRTLASQDVGIIYISHRLSEVQRLASRITVLRDGTTVAAMSMENIDQHKIVKLMLGESLSTAVLPDQQPRHGDTVLRVANISRGQAVQNVSFVLHAGEILGIAGLVGAGRTELVRLIFGCDRADSGSIQIHGESVAHPTPRRMLRQGLGFLPEDRKFQGLILDLSVRENMVVTVLDRISTMGFLLRKPEEQLVQGLIEELQIACSSAEVAAGTLSGGNQQKIVIGKWLATKPKILILDEPTRGIDVQAKAQIFGILNQLVEQGVSILFISSELEEVLLVSHRILTMTNGRIVDETLRKDAEMSKILLAATG